MKRNIVTGNLIVLLAVVTLVFRLTVRAQQEEPDSSFLVFFPLVGDQMVLSGPTPDNRANPESNTPTATSTIATGTPTSKLESTSTAIDTQTPSTTPTSTATETPTETPSPTPPPTATPTSTSTTEPDSFPDATFTCPTEPAAADAVKLQITVNTTAPASKGASFEFDVTSTEGAISIQPHGQLVVMFTGESSAEAPGSLAKCDVAGSCRATYTLTETNVDSLIGETVECSF